MDVRGFVVINFAVLYKIRYPRNCTPNVLQLRIVRAEHSLSCTILSRILYYTIEKYAKKKVQLFI